MCEKLNRFLSQLLGRLDKAQQDCDRNGGVASEEKPREDSAAQRETRRQFFVIESERLEKARRSMT